MMAGHIGFARQEDREGLRQLWLESFEDTPEAVDFFLERWLSPFSCVAAWEHGKVVSALYLLPGVWQEGKRSYQAQYIYGAATLPAFRGCGWMGKLLAFAGSTGARQRGDQVSCLLPATKSLYKFYARYGYRTAFYLRTVEKEREELEALAGTRERPCVVPALSPWEIREISMSQQTGIQWGRQMVEYAFAVNSLYGGGRVCTADGYALYRRQGDLAEILEWRCLGDMGALLAALLKDTDAELFRFRLSGRDALFPKEGDLIPFGMGKSLCQGLKIEKIQGETPYLGMTLD